MEITFAGHACFILSGSKKIVIDTMPLRGDQGRHLLHGLGHHIVQVDGMPVQLDFAARHARDQVVVPLHS